ncbi:uncharacterized protein CLUP02_13821 [Colletotrichum lupini]|uniref:Uncharacterized protein n=1 Tax=Colletotrichum lupini TaxID=145971 RepID=A0A9Q8WLT0_9PEZI|nr:uncharacterized protein CLUP02_13821 [Colletotrichum lupini]UQC88298.1 hypothetical protein CLUP02_13821 [Colletotrichum lupini]
MGNRAFGQNHHAWKMFQQRKSNAINCTFHSYLSTMILNNLVLLAGTVASLSTSSTLPHHENPEAISCSTSANQATPSWRQQQIFETFIQRFFV